MKIHNNLARLPTFIDRVYYSFILRYEDKLCQFCRVYYYLFGIYHICDLGRPADLWFTQFMVTLIQWSNAEFLPRSKKQHLDMAK